MCVQYLPKVLWALLTAYGGTFGTCAACGADVRTAFREIEGTYRTAADESRSPTAEGERCPALMPSLDASTPAWHAVKFRPAIL